MHVAMRCRNRNFLFLCCSIRLYRPTLHNNFENLQIEHDALKDLNLKLTTQFYIENSPANIEKTAKEELGMIKKQPKKIIQNEK